MCRCMALLSMQTALRALKEKGALDEHAVASFAERQRLVDTAAFDAMENSLRLGARTS